MRHAALLLVLALVTHPATARDQPGAGVVGEQVRPVAAQAAPPAPAYSDVEIRPQPGPQELFLSSDADIAIYGGSAFSGKTFALLLDDLRYVDDGDFAAVTFRRTTKQVTNPGGLWDESKKLYSKFGARHLSNALEHVFPSGAVIKFAHLEYDDSVYAWDGAQLPKVNFDQLEHFSAHQFFYMLSRNRDPSGKVKPNIRATCNPDPDSWLCEFLAWWLDPVTGYPDWSRAGAVRWFVRIDETIHWGATREELVEQFGPESMPLSVTFVPGRIWDNKIGMERDPGYLAKLKGMQRVERERLLGDKDLGGNWKVKASAGMMFRREWCETIEAEPEDVDWVRGWDLAATRKTDANDPDWTVGVKLGKYRGRNRWVISNDVKRLREGPAKVEDVMVKTAQADGRATRIRGPQDPGQAGKAQAKSLTGRLAGFRAKFTSVTGDKVTRFSPFSAQAEAGNVDLVKGMPPEFLRQLEGFPDLAHDDDADAVSEAFQEFVLPAPGTALLEHLRRQANDQAKEAAAAVAAQSAAPGPRPVQADRDHREAKEVARGFAAFVRARPRG